MSEMRVVDAIKRHLRNDRHQLTDEQKNIWTRIDHAWSLLCDVKHPRTDLEKVAILQHHYSISRNSAYNLMNWAKELYGDIESGKKEANRAIVLAYAMEAYRRAQVLGKPGDMNAAVANMIKVLGLDREDPELPDFSKIKAPAVVLGIPKATQLQLMNMIKGGVVDLNQKLPDAPFTSYEEVEEGN